MQSSKITDLNIFCREYIHFFNAYVKNIQGVCVWHIGKMLLTHPHSMLKLLVSGSGSSPDSAPQQGEPGKEQKELLSTQRTGGKSRLGVLLSAFASCCSNLGMDG